MQHIFVLMDATDRKAQLVPDRSRIQFVPSDHQPPVQQSMAQIFFRRHSDPFVRNRFASLSRLSIGILADDGAHGHVGTGDAGIQPVHIIRLHVIITVYECDEISTHGVQAGVPGIGQAAIGFVNHTDTIILPGPCVAQPRAVIRGTIVDQDYLKMPIGLRHYATHATIQ